MSSSRNSARPRRSRTGSVSYTDNHDDDDDDDSNKSDVKDDSSVEIRSGDDDDDDELEHDASEEEFGNGRRRPNKRDRGTLRISSRSNKASTNYQESSDDDDVDVEEEEKKHGDNSETDLAVEEPPSTASTDPSLALPSVAKETVEAALSIVKPPTKSPTRGKKRKSDASILSQTSDYSPNKNSDNNDSFQKDPEEPREFEPFKISKILARKSETALVWKDICSTMNTSVLDHGSRWTQVDPSSSDDAGTVVEERFLIKWSDVSYMHCSWENQADLLDLIDGATLALARFAAKYPDGLAYDINERCDGDYYDPAWVQVERILEIHFPEDCPCQSVDNEYQVSNQDLGIVLDMADGAYETGLGRHFLVKWGNQPYTTVTYEFERDLIMMNIEYKDQIKSFNKRSAVVDKESAKRLQSVGEAKLRKAYKEIFGERSDTRLEGAVEDYQKELEAHTYPNGGKLRDYQAEGVSWLMSNFVNKRSSVLADEMGLGKTIQLAAFLDILAKKFHRRGPFLIIVPLSTLCNWQRELDDWLGLNIIVYHGTAKNREMIRQMEFAHVHDRPKSFTAKELYLRKCAKKHKCVAGNPWMVEVVITTPELLCADDYTELTTIKWECVVVDEAHRLKNHSSKFAANLRDHKFSFGHKVLLTGTPIQNTMKELFALLNFIDPSLFGDCDDFLAKYGDIQSKDHIDELHEEIRPYILRRLKEDVEKSVPPKEETIIEVELTIAQKQYYRALYEKNVKFLHKNKKKPLDGPSLNNLAMQLRKCCNHLFLLNGIEEEFRAKEVAAGKTMSEGDLLVAASGKLVLLDKLLSRLKEKGHRILIFSQFKIMLDVLEDYLTARQFTKERIDGSITGKSRQQAIDRFQGTSNKESPFIMLLSTRAGGVGINLTAADTCIIFDSDWNPQNDLQAQARCHRIGQTKDVKIYRLLTAKTYEMQMFHMSSMKLGLDQAVLSGFEAGFSEEKALTKKEIEKLLRHGAYGILSEEKDGTGEAASSEFVHQDIDTILERRSRTVVHDNTGSQSKAAGGTFSKARFSSASSGGKKSTAEDIDIEDPNFWTKMVGEAKDDDDDDKASALPGKRARAATYSEKDYDKQLRKIIRNAESDSDVDADVEAEAEEDANQGGDDDEEAFEAESESEEEDLDEMYLDSGPPSSGKRKVATVSSPAEAPPAHLSPAAASAPVRAANGAGVATMTMGQMLRELDSYGLLTTHFLDESEVIAALLTARSRRAAAVMQHRNMNPMQMAQMQQRHMNPMQMAQMTYPGFPLGYPGYSNQQQPMNGNAIGYPQGGVHHGHANSNYQGNNNNQNQMGPPNNNGR